VARGWCCIVGLAFKHLLHADHALPDGGGLMSHFHGCTGGLFGHGGARLYSLFDLGERGAYLVDGVGLFITRGRDFRDDGSDTHGVFAHGGKFRSRSLGQAFAALDQTTDLL